MEDNELKKIKERKLQERMKKQGDDERRTPVTISEPRHLTDKDFDIEVNGANAALIDFYATWCGPCKMMAPIVETLAKEYSGKALVAKVDVDRNPGVSQRFGITAVPTFAVFKKGKLAGTVVGAVGKEALKDALNKAMR